MSFPMTLDELRKAGYRFLEHSHCKACRSVIEWWKTPAGKHMPMDVTDAGVAQAHWATCPRAAQFRKARA